METRFTSRIVSGRKRGLSQRVQRTPSLRAPEKTARGASLSMLNDLNEWLEAESEVLEPESTVREEHKVRRQTAGHQAGRDQPRTAVPVGKVPVGKKEDTVIKSKGNQLSCVMKLSHFLRYYQNMYGLELLPEEADEEAAKIGILIDRTGETTRESRRPVSDGARAL